MSGVWFPYAEERAEQRFDPDGDLFWREEAFGERPMLGPWGDPIHDLDAEPHSWLSDEVLECGLENPEVCEACD